MRKIEPDWRYSSCQMLRLIVLVVVLLGGSRAMADATDWLMKINKAAADVSFAGTFIYSHDGTIEAMEVVRRVKNGMMQERIFSLNGEPREVVRDENRVWCYIPDQNVGVHEYRQTLDSGFPRILPSDLDILKQNYRFNSGGTRRIANRMAQEVTVIPNDRYRYGYRLWADSESGLLLRSDLLDSSSKIVEQYLFVSIDLDSEISDFQLAAISNKDELDWYGMSTPKIEASAESSIWRVRQLPKGYQVSKHIRRMSPMDAAEIEHIILTDGLSNVSVFIKPGNPEQSGIQGLSRMGAVHAYRETVNNHRITVMGEVPAITVEFLAKAIEQQQ